LVGYLIRIVTGIVVVLVLWQFLPGLLENVLTP